MKPIYEVAYDEAAGMYVVKENGETLCLCISEVVALCIKIALEAWRGTMMIGASLTRTDARRGGKN